MVYGHSGHLPHCEFTETAVRWRCSCGRAWNSHGQAPSDDGLSTSALGRLLGGVCHIYAMLPFVTRPLPGRHRRAGRCLSFNKTPLRRVGDGLSERPRTCRPYWCILVFGRWWLVGFGYSVSVRACPPFHMAAACARAARHAPGRGSALSSDGKNHISRKC